MKTVITFVWLFFLVDQVGRRMMLLIGAAGGSACMWFIGAYIKLAGVNSSSASANAGKGLSSGGIAAMFFFYLWTAFYTPSWVSFQNSTNHPNLHHPPQPSIRFLMLIPSRNGSPWICNSEMFDTNTRSLGQASAAANNWFWNFIISRFTPQMFLKMEYGVYFFFASMMILSIIFVYFLLPETKGVPLEAMDRLFDIKPCSKAHAQVIKELREQEESFRHDAEGAGLTAQKTKEEFIEKVDSNV